MDMLKALRRVPALRFKPLFLVCTCLLVLACGGGNTASTPTPPTTPQPPQPPPDTCNQGATSTGGTKFTDQTGSPRCFAHLLAQVDSLKSNNTLPTGVRGVAIIYDFFYIDTDFRDWSKFSQTERGFDGQNNYYTTDFTHQRMSNTSHGAKVWQVYEDFSPVSASGVLSRTRDTFYKEHFAEQAVAAYKAGRAINPLVRATAYQSPKAIINMSMGSNFFIFKSFVRALETGTDFVRDTSAGNLSVAPGLIGVGGIGNSDAGWNNGFRKESTVILGSAHLQDGLSPSLGAIIDDPTVAMQNPVELNTILTDLILRTETNTLATLANHSGSTTPASRISTAFPDADTRERNLLTLAGDTQITQHFLDGKISLLDLLAAAVVHSRKGNLYTVTYLNSAGDALDFNDPCGVLRYGCFILPYLTQPLRGSSFAAPRLTAFIDTLWLIWPNLNKKQIHSLLSSCTKDLGATGVDPIYGQGLLDFECVVNPSGGVRIPGSQTQGVRGALYGASTASGGLTTYDAFDRNFEHTVLHRQLQAEAFDPFTHALAYKANRFLELTAKPESTSVWLTKQAFGNLNLAIGATYENNSLFGMTGSGHFAIYDGRSVGIRMEWNQPLHTFWSLRLNIAHYRGTASAAYPGAVSNLELSQSNASLSFERKFNRLSHAHLRFACSTGNTGSFNSFGTRIELFGVENCYRTIGAEIRF